MPTVRNTKIISKEEYYFLLQNGCQYEGYVRGLGYVYALFGFIVPPNQCAYNPKRNIPIIQTFYQPFWRAQIDNSPESITRSMEYKSSDVEKCLVKEVNGKLVVNMGKEKASVTVPNDPKAVRVTILDIGGSLCLHVMIRDSKTGKQYNTPVCHLRDFYKIFGVPLLKAGEKKDMVEGQGGTPWMTAAEGQLGVTEIAGSKHDPNVIGYHATTGGFKDDETPWCSSFVNWSIKQAGIKGTNSARALSWCEWEQSLKKPAFCSIAIINYGSGKGHVGFVAGVNSNGSIVLLGGNQSNMVRYSSFSLSSISRYEYPSGYNPNYTLPTLIINKAGGFESTR